MVDDDVLGVAAVSSLVRNESMMDWGKVWPFSHMSSSLRIFSYRRHKMVSDYSSRRGRVMPRGRAVELRITAGNPEADRLVSSRRLAGGRRRRCALTTPTGTRQDWLGWLAYLLVRRSRVRDVIHQDGHELGHPVDACGKGPISSRAVYRLALGLGLLEPLAGYRVYNVQHAQLVISIRLLEVGVEFLNEHGFRLERALATELAVHRRGGEVQGVFVLTWTLATHSAVREAILVPETPGGFRVDMAWRPVSRSATAEAMIQAKVMMSKGCGDWLGGGEACAPSRYKEGERRRCLGCKRKRTSDARKDGI